jgi:hypothetical protein
MVPFVPLSRDLLVMVVKLSVISAILVISILAGVLIIFILVAILIIRILSVLCRRRASDRSEHDDYKGGQPKPFRYVHYEVSF